MTVAGERPPGRARPRVVRPRPLLAATGALTLCCLAAGLLPPAPAAASCAGPQHLEVDTGARRSAPSTPAAPSPVVVPAAGEVEVSGVGFADGCDDTGGGLGCQGPPPVVPMRDVDLVLEQGGSTWTLGTADAAGPQEGFAVGWRVRLPADVAPGPAVLRARTAEREVLVEP